MPKVEAPPLSAHVSRTFLRPTPGEKRQTVRLKQQTSLDSATVRRELAAETIVTLPVRDASVTATGIAVINVLSPYTNGSHVMLVDSTPHYRPTPSELPDRDGEAMMAVAAKIVAFQQGMSGYNNQVCFGYNNSPLSFGTEEEVTGMQSLTTKHHLHVWNNAQPEETVPVVELSENQRNFMQGDSLTKIGGELVRHFLTRYGQFVDMESAEVSERGFQAQLTTDLLTALQTPGFFTGFIKPLHEHLEQAAGDVMDALTNMDYDGLKRRVKRHFEGEPEEGLYAALQENPRLLSPDERRRKIDELSPKGYPEQFIEALLELNPSLKDREEVDESHWIRKGLGYALVITQQRGEAVARIYIRPAVKIASSRGGVAETVNIAVQRVESADANETEIQRNAVNNQALKEVLSS